ncbi:MAG: hypothetical protein Q8S39_08040 [Ignavibacteria bacterium]|nr:hypothetical protein [Ignavibacteria bacterium]
MPGNELSVTSFLFENLNKITLPHIGLVKELGAPLSSGSFQIINSSMDIALISTQDASKKADIYINGVGVSIKQRGSSFSFNRLQRHDLLFVFTELAFSNPELTLLQLDREVDNFHKGLIKKRSRPWRGLFSETDFKKLLEYLMMKGSPNLGISANPAEYILEAPASINSSTDIKIFRFDEYFNQTKESLSIAIRRQWIGQSSDSEHSRAFGLNRKSGNQPWVYKDISGLPRISKKTGLRWRLDTPENERRTVYLIFIEKTI